MGGNDKVATRVYYRGRFYASPAILHLLDSDTLCQIPTTSKLVLFKNIQIARNRSLPRVIDIRALRNSQPVSHKLERDDVVQALEDIDCRGHLDLLSLARWELGVVLVADNDGLATTGNDLLVRVQTLGEDGVACEDHDDRKVVVNERQHTVLQLTGHDSLTVQVRDLLDLQGA